MPWTVQFHPSFRREFLGFPASVQDAMNDRFQRLEHFGPRLGRPDVDTLRDSRHANMKELRLDADRGVWRIAFAFDPRRRAIMLVAGNKRGANERRFYRRLVRQADARYDEHLDQLAPSEDFPC